MASESKFKRWETPYRHLLMSTPEVDESTVYYSSFTAKGKRYRRNLGTDLESALEELDSIMDESLRGTESHNRLYPPFELSGRLYDTPYRGLRMTTPAVNKSTVYYAEFRIEGKRYRRKLDKDLDVALEKMDSLIDSIKNPKPMKPPRLRELQALNREKIEGKVLAQTLEEYEAYDEEAAKSLGDPYVINVTKEGVEGWLTSLISRHEYGEVKKYAKRLRQVFNWSVRCKRLEKYPEIEVPKLREKFLFYLSEGQELALKRASKPKVWLAIYLGILTGLELPEILSEL